MVSELERTPTAGNAIAFSRDARLIGTADGDAVRIYGARTGKLLSGNNEFFFEALAVDFTFDGKQAIASEWRHSDRVLQRLYRKLAAPKKIMSPVVTPRTGEQIFPRLEPGPELGWGSQAY